MSNPYQMPGKPPGGSYMNPQMQQGFSVCQPLADNATWMQVIGWVMLVYGVIVCIGIISAIVGIPIALVGYNIKEAAAKYKAGVPHNPNLQLEASRHLGTAFMIWGILSVIGLVLTLLYMLFWIVMISIIFAGAAAQ